MEEKNKPAPWLGDYTKVQRQAHSTKSGPGRRHVQGQPHGAAEKPQKGAPPGFVQHTNPKRNAERKLVKEFGARAVRLHGFRLSLASKGRI